MSEARAATAQGEVAWYARPEAAGTWRIPACEPHGGELLRHRFARVGREVQSRAAAIRTAESCEICRKPELLEEVERCTCETDTARCPAHQNVGCGG